MLSFYFLLTFSLLSIPLSLPASVLPTTAPPLSPSPIYGNKTQFRPVTGRFTVDLDAPAATRWNDVITAANYPELKAFISNVFSLLNMTKLRPLLEDILGKGI